MAGFLSKLLTVGEGKQMKRYQAKVDAINALEPSMKQLGDEALRALTPRFRERLNAGEPLDDLLVEAFAAVREASARVRGLRHFDVQLIGGMALNDGQIAEMKTGEGKTLVSTLAGYLNALGGENVHIVTVNDYLARRDSEWMGAIYRFMGMEVGLIQNGMRIDRKKPAYQADVTYGTNSEFGFDYLRDNMVTRASARVQRGHHFAIVDEVDSILIDEARTPLIISGAGAQAADTYNKFARVMPGLREGVDFEMDEAKRTINATESGLERIESMLGIDDIYADPTGLLPNHLQQALKAQFLFHRDVDYVVVGGEVKIVDEFTGRIMEGRRYSEGLHQALEAKEHVLVREENQTLATITLQNYFRLYSKLSGMTGTAMTEDAEFRQIYKLPVVAIPPNRPVIRKDENDLVYRTIDAKFNAVADDVAERHAVGQPCLIGTVSIESSERLSRLLDKRGIRHETLNAKNHEREAHIVAQAGRLGAVTIATNMAGRGTDILLGGNPNFMANDLLLARGVDPAEASDEDKAAALERARKICADEKQKVIEAGAVIMGGHSIDDEEPKYGLCVFGTVAPDALVRNEGAKPGDTLYLTKPLGTGIASAGRKVGILDVAAFSPVVESMAELNRAAGEAMVAADVHAATDVTGFGLAGHLHEMLSASACAASINWSGVPTFAETVDLARQWCRPARSFSVEDFSQPFLHVPDNQMGEDATAVLCDPQTSGGMLCAIPPEAAATFEEEFAARCGRTPAKIGRVIEGESGHIHVVE